MVLLFSLPPNAKSGREVWEDHLGAVALPGFALPCVAKQSKARQGPCLALFGSAWPGFVSRDSSQLTVKVVVGEGREMKMQNRNWSVKQGNQM